MDVLDWILTLIRWFHALAAVAWVGGSIFYVLVLWPARRRSGTSVPYENDAIAKEFRSLVNPALGVLLLTGVVLSASRLTDDAASVPYMAVLAFKVVLALYMFYTVRFLSRSSAPDQVGPHQGKWRRWKSNLSGNMAVLSIGVVVFGLADVLAALFESNLTD